VIGSGLRPRVFGMIVDALILAGGRSSRLGGRPKSRLRLDGETLLDRTVRAVHDSGARNVVVVGDEAPDGVVTIREDPAFGGPVAAIAAGLSVLPGDSDAILVLACDMPAIAEALPLLLAAPDMIAVDRERPQQLAIVASTASLVGAVAALPRVEDAAVRDLVAGLALSPVAVPEGSTDDVDTWDDAARFGIVELAGRA
jgi:molybdopterin-guanine dinucleotide biosynthesis protein A